MQVEKLNTLNDIYKISKEKGVIGNELIYYLSLMNNSRFQEIKKNLSKEQICEILDRVDSVYLEMTYINFSIAEIVDYIVEHLEIIGEMTDTEILEDIAEDLDY